MTIRTIWSRGILGALLLALTWGGAAVAAPVRDAEPDSVRPPGFLNAIDFHPSYQSGYSVNRTTRSWNQNLNYARRVSMFDLTNSWSVGIRKDRQQNDLHAKTGEMKFGLNYLLKDLGDWTFGLDGEFHRDGSFSTFKTAPAPRNRRDQVQHTSDFGLAIGSGLPKTVMHRLLPFLREFNLTTAGSTGINSERNISRRQGFLDSTRVTGIYRKYDVGLDGNVRAFRLTTHLSTDRSTGDTKTIQRDVVTLEPTGRPVKDSVNNRRKNLQASVDYAKGEALRANLQGHLIDEVNQYWDILANASEGAQETKDGKDRGAGITLDWKPDPGLTLHGDYSRQDTQADYRIQSRDFFKRTDSGKITGKLKVPSFFLLLSGVEIESGLEINEANSLNEIDADFRQTNRKLRHVLRRQLGPKIQIQATNELSLRQYFYADKSNDNDERRVFNDGVLLYNPSMMFNGTLNVNWSERHAISVPSAKSANNSTTQSYRVSGEIGYKRHQISVNQRYTIEANYTFYDFNDAQNSLARSNEVMTTLSDRLGSGWNFQMQHLYGFRDTGSYVRPAPKLPRGYSATTKETHHSLTLIASYPIGTEITIEARQMFDTRSTRGVVSGRVTTTNRGELALRGNMNHKFNDDFSLLASFQKTQSTSEKNYWTVNASIQRNF